MTEPIKTDQPGIESVAQTPAQQPTMLAKTPNPVIGVLQLCGGVVFLTLCLHGSMGGIGPWLLAIGLTLSGTAGLAISILGAGKK